MKIITTLLFLSFGALSYGHHLEISSICTEDNYKKYIYRAGIYGCELKSANLIGLDFSQTNFVFADLRFADLSESNFVEADLRLADFRMADLTNANFARADLQGANLQRADINGADFTNAKVDLALGKYLSSKDITGFIIIIR